MTRFHYHLKFIIGPCGVISRHFNTDAVFEYYSLFLDQTIETVGISHQILGGWYLAELFDSHNNSNETSAYHAR